MGTHRGGARVVYACVRPSCPSVCPSITSDKVHIRPISKYSSIFEHILENIHRICPLRPILNRQNQLSVCHVLQQRLCPLTRPIRQPWGGRARLRGGAHLIPRGYKRAPRGIIEPLRDIYEPQGGLKEARARTYRGGGAHA
jgi:hypothetical protein